MLHTHFNRLHKTCQLHFTGAQKTFSLIPVFLDSPLLKPALNCRFRKFKQKKKILSLAWTSDFHWSLEWNHMPASG